MAELRLRSDKYAGDNLEQQIPVDPQLLNGKKRTVFCFHDESTVHANERPKYAWLPDNMNELRKKGRGRLIHNSDWIVEDRSTGRLTISPQDIQQVQSEYGLVPKFTDAAIVTYPGANGDKWWDCSQLIEQVKTRAIPIFNYLFPDAQGVFVFDFSSAHESYGPHALRVSNINFLPGGKKLPLRDTFMPMDDPRIPLELQGRPQSLVYPQDHPTQTLAGKTKGVRCVLQERGLWELYVAKSKEAGKNPVFRCASCQLTETKRDQAAREARLQREKEAQDAFERNKEMENQAFKDTDDPMCCAARILSLQSDFANEKPLLQKVIEEAGHICIFLPKFHCELNPIEIYWVFIKHCKFHFNHNHLN